MERNEHLRNKLILNAFRHWNHEFSFSRLVKAIYECNETRVGTYWKTIQESIEGREDSLVGGLFFYHDHIVTPALIDQIVRDFSSIPGIDEPFQYSAVTESLSYLMDLSRAEKHLVQIAEYARSLNYHQRPILSAIQEIHLFRDNKPKLFAMTLALPEKEVKAAFDGFLFKTGVLAEADFLLDMGEDFGDIYELGCSSAKDIEEALFPNHIKTDLTLSDYKYIKPQVERVGAILENALKTNTRGINIMLWGDAGLGKTELSFALAKKHGLRLKTIGDISEKDTSEKSRSARLSNLKIAMKLFRDEKDVVLLFDEMEDLFKSDTNAQFSKAFINRIIETTPVPIIWTTNSLHLLGSPVLRRMTYNIECKVPDATARRDIWKRYAREFRVKLTKDSFNLLDNFDISPALIKNTMRIAGSAMTEQDKENSNAFLKDIITSLDTLVQYGETRKFDNAEPESLYDVECANTDHEMVNFTERLVGAKSHAFSLCLYGKQGTGKSEYARYLAKQMGKKVLFKRASDLQSMFVGGTEKNIANAFEQAKEEKKVLIIDEGDSFLQDRRKARASWEISQVNEMLSQMERHTEPFIITTNLMDNLDAASMRRFAFKLQFNYLTEAQSKKLFKTYFKMKAPASLVNMPHLAPGDFANVKRQTDILGITQAEEIVKMLQTEIEFKKEEKPSRKLGF